MSRPTSRRRQFDSDLIPGQVRTSGATFALHLFVGLVLVFGAGLAIALVTA
jgi:hypothetical protein